MSSSKGKVKARQAQQARRPAARAGSSARADNLNRGKNGNTDNLDAATSRASGKNGSGVSGGSATQTGKNGNGAPTSNGTSLRNRRVTATRPTTNGTYRPGHTGTVQPAPASENPLHSYTAGASATSLRRVTTNSHAPALLTAEREPPESAELAPRPARGRTTAALAELPAPTIEDLPEPPEERSPLPRRPLRERAEAAGDAIRMHLRAMTLEQWLWLGVLTVAAVLRFWGLGDKPLHHDESMHAYFSLQFAENPGGYAYNPLLHGPFQFHAEGLVFALILGLQAIFAHGAVGNPWINDTTARILPALFGLGIVALPLGLRRELGRVGAPTAAFLLAVSPTFVYFSRFLREDIYFCFFMFAMVVCAVRFAHSHATKWFVGLFAATVLAYATFEGTFLTLAIFVGFLAVVLVWDLGHGLAGLLPGSFSSRERVLLTRAGLLCLLGAVAAVVAKIGLQKLNELSTYINNPKNQTAADTQVRLLEDRSVAVLLYVSIAVALLVIGTLLWQMYRDDLIYGRPEEYDAFADDEAYVAALQGRYRASRAARVDRILSAPSRGIARLRARLDPERQSFLRLLLGVTWVQWFVAFVVAWMLFAALFWIIPPGPTDNPAPTIGAGFQRGVGLGLWQGLYYWIQQQQVARGGQPWYYYLLVIPLYEQLAVVFGLGGAVYSFFRPNRFRLFLVWWFAASLFLYSWAGEKMPWLTIQILLPLFLLAAVALARLLEAAYAVFERFRGQPLTFGRPLRVLVQPAILGVLLAGLLLIPMIHNMLTLSQVDAAVAPREMLVYVQTTPDWTRVMNKIQALDQRLYGGRHLISIGVGVGMEWPTYWSLRDYPNAHFGYDPTVAGAVPVDVMLLAQWEPDGQQYLSATPAGWSAHQYKLRWWWDEGYKPRPCVPTKTTACPPPSDFLLYGIGLGPYLSYGQPAAKGQPDFDLGKAIGRIWNWEWTRTPIGSPDPGSTDFAFVVRAGLPIQAYP